MPSEQWLEDHGYQRIRCSCGWSGLTDTGVCEGCGPDVEYCSCCDEERDDCECWECRECGDKNRDDETECHCGTGRSYQTLCHSTVHVARKEYPLVGIFPGDKYRRTVFGGYYKGAGRWLSVERRLIRRKVA